jgi:hypothetical protein
MSNRPASLDRLIAGMVSAISESASRSVLRIFKSSAHSSFCAFVAFVEYVAIDRVAASNTPSAARLVLLGVGVRRVGRFGLLVRLIELAQRLVVHASLFTLTALVSVISFSRPLMRLSCTPWLLLSAALCSELRVSMSLSCVATTLFFSSLIVSSTASSTFFTIMRWSADSR